MANSITDYLSAVPYTASESYPGFFIIGHGVSSIYACSYKTKNNSKNQIVAISNQVSGMKLRSGEFEFHHIIERQHLADISIHGKLEQYYHEFIPTVMIHTSEHRLYNSLLHMKEMRLIYTNNQPTGDWRSREMAAGKIAKEKGGIGQLNSRIAILFQMYQEVYLNSYTFRSIAGRIFEDFRILLKH